MSMTLATVALASALPAPAVADHANQPPVAVVAADPTVGPAPLTSRFDARASTDPNPGDSLTYAWDFDADGLADATGPTATRTFVTLGLYTVTLRVTDAGGLTDTTSVDVFATNTPPTPEILAPGIEAGWRAGEPIRFVGVGHDLEEGVVAPAALEWTFATRRCAPADPTACETEVLRTATGAEVTLFPPDRVEPSHLLVTLRAVDVGGLETEITRRFDPQLVEVSIDSDPSGTVLRVGGAPLAGPIVRTAVAGSRLPVQAPGSIVADGVPMTLVGWSDGGAASHDALVPAAPTATLTAIYRNHAPLPRIVSTPSGDALLLDASGTVDPDAGDVLAFTWDLDDDGAYDDASGPVARVARRAGAPRARVRVSDLARNEAIAVATTSPEPLVAGGRQVGVAAKCPAGRFMARYFANTTLTGPAVTSRCEQTIGRTLGHRPPVAGVGPDGYSASWTGSIRSTGGRHVLRVAARGGVRVWVGGRLVLDRWDDAKRAHGQVTVHLPKGESAVRVAFVDRSGPARLAVTIRPTG